MDVITTHINADFDSLASMLAAKKLYPQAALVFPGSQEKNLRDFFIQSTFYVFETERIKNIDLDKVRPVDSGRHPPTWKNRKVRQTGSTPREWKYIFLTTTQPLRRIFGVR